MQNNVQTNDEGKTTVVVHVKKKDAKSEAQRLLKEARYPALISSGPSGLPCGCSGTFALHNMLPEATSKATSPKFTSPWNI